MEPDEQGHQPPLRDVATLSYLGTRDPTTRRLIEEILANEEEHADDLASLLPNVSARARTARL